MSCTQNSFRSTSLAGAYPRRVETCICTTFQWQSSFLCSLHSAVRSRCSLHLPSQFQVPSRTFEPCRERDAGSRLAEKTVAGRKDVLPLFSSSPRVWCRTVSLGQRKANPSSVSLVIHFAEREQRKILAEHTVDACSTHAEELHG